MTPRPSRSCLPSVPFSAIAVLVRGAAALISLSASLAFGQATAPNNPNNPNSPPTRVTPEQPVATPPAETAATASGKSVVPQLLDSQRLAPVRRATAAGDGSAGAKLVTEAGSGNPVGEGSRVLRLPGKCDPRTGSLDCVADTGAGGGANVSDRVRNGVINEVGAGRAATQGAGSAKGQQTCTPAPGKLTCE